MKHSYLKFISLVAFSTMALTGCDLFKKKTESEENYYDEEDDAKAIKSYYSGISSSLSGEELLSSLRSLNSKKKTKTITYKEMGTNSAASPFKYTDFDTSKVKKNSEGVYYGTQVSSFYSGKTTSTFNREHVWPNSRGGNIVEDDILMIRPTVTEENSDRGNSTYVTGMATEHDGWDPVTAFKNTEIGVYKGVRGECARIVFYSMTASDSLVLNDETGNSGNNMGSLTNLVQWACQNPVNIREKRRNVGGQYVQGNRNAFVDHPEYVCKIWGSYNSKTKAACEKANYSVK